MGTTGTAPPSGAVCRELSLFSETYAGLDGQAVALPRRKGLTAEIPGAWEKLLLKSYFTVTLVCSTDYIITDIVGNGIQHSV